MLLQTLTYFVKSSTGQGNIFPGSRLFVRPFAFLSLMWYFVICHQCYRQSTYGQIQFDNTKRFDCFFFLQKMGPESWEISRILPIPIEILKPTCSFRNFLVLGQECFVEHCARRMFHSWTDVDDGLSVVTAPRFFPELLMVSRRHV